MAKTNPVEFVQEVREEARKIILAEPQGDR